MNYQFRVLHLKSGKRRLLIDFENKEYEILSVFLESEVAAFEDWIKEKLDNVISKKVDEEQVNGNICHAKIGREYTEISDNLAGDGIGKKCVLETKQLADLVKAWCEEKHKFDKNDSYS